MRSWRWPSMKTQKDHKHNYDPILKGCDTCEDKPIAAIERVSASEHTPTPLMKVEIIDGSYVIFDKFNRCIAKALTQEAAAFIVRAVNSHEEMLNALKFVADRLTLGGQAQEENITIVVRGVMSKAIFDAIAKAEGK